MPAKKGEKLQLYFRGGNVDTNVEIQSLGEGVYISSTNMRLASEGDKKILVKIGGEELDVFYTSITNELNNIGTAGDYVCVGATIVNNQIVALWADNKMLDPNCISVGPNIVLSSIDFPIQCNKPVQIISNNNEGGEIYINDTYAKPMIFSIEDMVDNRAESKYFADFNLIEYIIQLNVSMNQPVFEELVNVGLGSGLPAGSYSYSLRYIDLDGNGTAWTVCTPVINVAENIQTKENVFFQGAGTYGGISDPVRNTKYGIKLKMRINNIANYSYLELKRMTYNSAQALVFIPQPEKIQVISVDIVNNPYSIVEFIDDGTRQWEILAGSSSEALAVMEKANSIRYFLNRLVLMGPTYESRIIDTTNLFLASENDNIAYPVIRNLFQYGHSDVWNQTYRKSLMRGERYGWAVEFVDAAGTKSFAIPYKSDGVSGVTDFTNYLIPNRRETISEDTEMVSRLGNNVFCSDVNSHDQGSVSKTHEVFDNRGSSVTKSLTHTIDVTTLGSNLYTPFTPTGDPTGYQDNQKNLNGLGFYINDQAEGSAYSPQGWNPQIFSLGMCFRGIDETKLPDWVEGFSILRSEPAGRIVCQGIGYYSLDEQSSGPIHKNLGKVWFYSPDIDPTIGIKSDVYDELLNDPDSFQIQLVAPLGFYSEVWGGTITNGLLDMISYARILYDNGEYNLEAATNIGWTDGSNDGFVAFGRWRNNAASGNANMAAAIYNDTTQFIFDISDADEVTIEGHSGRSQYLELTLTSQVVGSPNLYIKDETGIDDNFADANVSLWHEPFYIINIIKNDAVVAQQNIDTYYKTGHYQKLKSLIGYGTAGILTLPLVDERHDDCILYEEITGVHDGGNNQHDLTDSSKNWLVNDLVGCTVLNVTDGSRGIILSNTDDDAVLSSVPGGLIGGTDDDFDDGDVYVILKFNEDVYSIGSHTGADNQNNLTDSNANWATDELKGYTIVNYWDGSYAIISANTLNTVTTSLQAGNEDLWDGGDKYFIITNRYVYVDDKPWLTNIPLGLYGSIMTDIDTNGYYDDGNRDIYGVCHGYKVSETESYIEFDRDHFDARYTALGYSLTFYRPSQDDEVDVRYDNRAFIKVFGGDTYIGDALFVPIDSQMQLDQTVIINKTNCYKLRIGFPYLNYDMHPNYYIPFDKTSTTNDATLVLEYMRQMACLFTCESKVDLPLLYNDSFPKKNYVIRPLEVESTDFALGAADVYDHHAFWQFYENDYEDEFLNWQYGGFHFLGTSNIDYSKRLLDSANYTQPAAGFSEILSFPNRTIWSLSRLNPSIISSLKCFPVLNAFDGDDQQGIITHAYHANTSKGDNLYAITEKGICLLITDKRILSELTGGELGIMATSESFIAGEYWLYKDIGIDYQNWRTVAEHNEILYFANSESVYKLENNVAFDIGRQGWHKKLFDEGLDEMGIKSMIFNYLTNKSGSRNEVVKPNGSFGPMLYYYNNKTYGCWEQRGGVGYSCESMVYAIYHRKFKISGSYGVGYGTLNATDPHAVPVILVADDKHIVVAHEKLTGVGDPAHNGVMEIKRSDNLEDETLWVNAIAHNANYYAALGTAAGGGPRFSYPSLDKLANGKLFLFCRHSSTSELDRVSIHRSNDHGVSWNDLGGNIDGGCDVLDLSPPATGSDLIYKGLCKHPYDNSLHLMVWWKDAPVNDYPDLYYLKSLDNGVTWQSVDGAHSQDITTGGNNPIMKTTLDNAANHYLVKNSVPPERIIPRDGVITDTGIPYIAAMKGAAGAYKPFIYYWNGAAWVETDMGFAVSVEPVAVIFQRENVMEILFADEQATTFERNVYRSRNLTSMNDWTLVKTIYESPIEAYEMGRIEATFNYTIADYEAFAAMTNRQTDYSDIIVYSEMKDADVSTVFDKRHNEYWLSIKGVSPQVFIFSTDNASDEYPYGMWVSKFAYEFDQFIALGLDVYGIKEGKFYKLNIGTEINGSAFDAELIQTVVPELGRSSEFVDIKVYSDNKPTQIQFAKTLAGLPQATLSSALGSNYLRDYGYWYNKIPRISTGSNYRIQGRVMYFKIIHSAEEDFKLSATSVGFKTLRLH